MKTKFYYIQVSKHFHNWDGLAGLIKQQYPDGPAFKKQEVNRTLSNGWALFLMLRRRKKEVKVCRLDAASTTGSHFTT